MKKTISILLAMLMIIPFAVPFASAAEAIGKISITVDTDIDGVSVDNYSDYVTIESEGVIFEESNNPAVEAFNTTTENYDSEFAGGNYYVFTIRLTEAPYYALPSAGSFAEVEVNGVKYAALVQEKNTGSGPISYISLEIELYVGDPMKNLKAIDFHVPAPVAGAVPADVSQVTADNMGVIVVGIEWFPSDPVFVVGTQYSYQLALETAEGYTFDKNIYLSHDMADAVKIGSGKNELKMTYKFPAVEAIKITTADFTVTAPVTGEIPATTADVSCSDSNITVASVEWDPVDSPFKSNIEYSVILSIEAATNYKFDNTSSFTVNGQPAIRIGSGAEELKVCYVFPATVVPEYSISITNGVASSSTSTAGSLIYITADTAPVGMEFERWIVNGATLDDAYSSETSFIMPGNDVTIEATYREIFYSITVINAAASESSAFMGETIDLEAHEAPEGMEFDKCVVSGATLSDVTQPVISFTMPNSNVTAEATYKYINYTVTVVNGTSAVSTAIIGDTVNIKAPKVNGKFFVKWESEDVAFSDATKSETSFTMPAKNVTLTAVYDDFELAIEKPSNTTVFYKNNIDIKATVGELPEGATVEWTTNNDCFELSSGDSGKCVGTARKRGTSVFTAKIKLSDGTYATDSEGNTLSSSIEITVKYAWWQWIIIILLFGWIWY